MPQEVSVKLQIEYIINNRKPDGRAQDILNSTDRAKDFSWMQIRSNSEDPCQFS